MYDDNTVKVNSHSIVNHVFYCALFLVVLCCNLSHVQVIGGWADVLTMCERGHLQPQVLFFEAVN